MDCLTGHCVEDRTSNSVCENFQDKPVVIKGCQNVERCVDIGGIA